MVMIMKKLILLLIVISLMICVCGCSVSNMKGQDKIDRMLSYINNKYADDSFEYVSVTGGHLGSNTTKIIVKSEKFPEKEIRVICSEVDGDQVFSDTYLNVKFEEQTYTYIRDALTRLYGDNIYLKYIPDYTASMEGGTSSTTFEEYIADSSTCIYFSAAVPGKADNEEEELSKIKDSFKNAVVSGHIFYIDSNESIQDSANALIDAKAYAKRLYIVKENISEYSKTEWTDGA